jgi:acyl carrier protein
MPRLEEVIASVMSVDASAISDGDGPGTIETWDSLNHVMLAGVLEEQFGVTLTADELVEAATVADFRRILRTKGCEA